MSRLSSLVVAATTLIAGFAVQTPAAHATPLRAASPVDHTSAVQSVSHRRWRRSGAIIVRPYAYPSFGYRRYGAYAYPDYYQPYGYGYGSPYGYYGSPRMPRESGAQKR